MKVGIVIPCYNEADRLRTADFIDFISVRPDWTLVLVDDGSRDETASVLDELAANLRGQATVIRLEKNFGKAQAVRRGILKALEAGSDLVGFLDADQSTPLSEAEAIISMFEGQSWMMVFGSRIRTLNSDIARRNWRHGLGRIFAYFAGRVIDLPVYDTQCGAKFFRADTARDIFREKFISRWFFDLEIFIRSKRIWGGDLRRFALEYVLHSWRDDGDTRLRLKDFISVPWELWKIHRYYRRG